jgi:hypothetical protein
MQICTLPCPTNRLPDRGQNHLADKTHYRQAPTLPLSAHLSTALPLELVLSEPGIRYNHCKLVCSMHTYHSKGLYDHYTMIRIAPPEQIP